MTIDMQIDIIHPKAKYVCGVDINRRGTDETAIVVVMQAPFASDDNALFVCYLEATNTQSLPTILGRIKYLHNIFDFEKIYIDSTGIGAGVLDFASISLAGTVEEVIFTRKSKPEMFYNLLNLFQKGKLKIPNYYNNSDERIKKLFFQLLSIKREFADDSDIPKISHEEGTHDDFVTALAMACLYFKTRRNRHYSIVGV